MAHRLPLVLRAHRVLRAAVLRCQPFLELDAQLRDSRAELAHSLQKPKHERIPEGLRKRGQRALAGALELREVLVRLYLAGPALDQLIG